MGGKSPVKLFTLHPALCSPDHIHVKRYPPPDPKKRCFPFKPGGFSLPSLLLQRVLCISGDMEEGTGLIYLPPKPYSRHAQEAHQRELWKITCLKVLPQRGSLCMYEHHPYWLCTSVGFFFFFFFTIYVTVVD